MITLPYYVLALLFCLSTALSLFVFLSWKKLQPSPPQKDDNDGEDDPSLLKTKRELYREISRHRATEQLLRETQEYMLSIIHSMPSILIGVTPEGYITHWNRAAERATGLSADETVGALINHVFPDLPITIDIIRDTIRKGSPYIRESIQRGLGPQAKFTDLTVYPLLASENSGVVILADDVTKRVRIENMMIQNEKMMSLGEMAAGMAHEINNPLSGIINNIQNIFRRISSDLEVNQNVAKDIGVDLDKVRSYLEQRSILQFLDNIREGGERAAQIVTNMLEFSRSSSRNRTPTDILELIDHTLELAANTFQLKTNLGVELPEIRKNYPDDLPLVPCSSTEFQQVILNLLRNAAQALHSEEYGPPLDPVIGIDVHFDDDYVTIEISDNGPGMPENVSRHIFEPFFTTKDVGQGTGLGLSVSYFIITEHHNGSIEVHTNPGEGTRFVIRLPLYETPVDNA